MLTFLYKSFYKLLNYFHCSLWADLLIDRPDRPVAVISYPRDSKKMNATNFASNFYSYSRAY